jgi:hypothetical protein
VRIDEQVHGLLASLPGLGEIDDGELGERLERLERVVNAAQAAQAEVMAEMLQRARSSDAELEEALGRALLPNETRADFVDDEIAVTLACTKAAAASRCDIAHQAAAHPSVMSAWRSGRIDVRKVQALCDELEGVAPEAAREMAELAATYAESHTAPEVRRWLRRRVLAADPDLADARRTRAHAGRRVTFGALPDGVAELHAVLPALAARQVYDTVNAVAAAAVAGDIRTMDQRRADALVDLVLGRADPPQVGVQVVVPVASLTGDSKQPAEVAGVGPVTPGEALELIGASDANVAFRRMLTDPDSGQLIDLSERQYRPSSALARAVRARDRVCRFPGCSRPATERQGTDLDHTVPWPRGETSATNLAVLCRHHHRLKHSPGWNAVLRADGVMEWTSPTGRVYTSEPWDYSDTG